MDVKKEKLEDKKFIKDDHILTVLLITLAIPISMSMWIMNIIYSKLLLNTEGLDGKYIFLLL